MKRITLWSRRAGLVIVLIVVIGGITALWPQLKHVEYQRVEVEKEVIKEVPALERKIREVQDAERARLEASAQAAYDEAMKKGLLEIELAVTTEYRKEIEAREAELEGQVSF